MTTIAFTRNATPPDVLSGLAQAERYRYVRGQSGQRYIFTRMTASDLADCRQAVVLLLSNTDGPAAEGTPVWLGEIDGSGKRHGAGLNKKKLAASDIYVHLLAENAARRRAILTDLATVLATA